MNRDELLASINIVDVVERRIGRLKKQGREYVACCPFHNEKSPSFKVNKDKQLFKCFGCNEGGNAIDFVVKHDNVTFVEAMKILKDDVGYIEPKAKAEQRIDDPQIEPPLNSKPSFHHSSYGVPIKVWTYSKGGKPYGYVARYQGPDRKEIIPYTYRKSGQWKAKGFDAPRPLYNLDELAARPTAPVLVVEGEPAADAAIDLFKKMVVVTWNGGTNATGLTDWKPLLGRLVVLSPDNDRTQCYPKTHAKAGQVKPYHEQPGPKAMHLIASTLLLADPTTKVKWLDAPEGSPDKWDWADFKGTQDEARTYLNKFNVDYKPPVADTSDFIDEPPPPPKVETPAPENPPPPPKAKAAQDDDDLIVETQALFRALGHNKSESGQSEFYFFSSKAGQVLTFKPSNFTANALMQLADLEYFMTIFPNKKGFDMERTIQALQNLCFKRGVFNPSNTRGIGAWMDDGRTVIHSGDHLLVNGERAELHTIRSRYLYERDEPFNFTITEPLSSADSSRFLEVIDRFNWDRKINSYLFGGWCMIAPICGALKWRPHIWLTGPRGSGKSTALKVAEMMVGKIGIKVQGATSEAGLRQTLNHDARPILFDEVDPDSKKAMEGIEAVLALMRSASTHDGGDIIKGGQSGNAKAYKIRSCFAFSSINTQVTNAADSSRVTILSLFAPSALKAQTSIAKWEETEAMIADLLSPGYIERMISRTVVNLPTLLANAETFSRAAASVLKEQRAGDQLGALLAGAYLIKRTDLISYDDAKAWVADRIDDWDVVAEGRHVKDEFNLLSHIVQYRVTVDNSIGTKVTRTIGELIITATKGAFDNEIINRDNANENLMRLGIKVARDKGYVYIFNTSKPIMQILKETAWAKKYSDTLGRIERSVRVESMRFLGDKGRAVGVPLDLIVEDWQTEIPSHQPTYGQVKQAGATNNYAGATDDEVFAQREAPF